jgi:hypothetical protein
MSFFVTATLAVAATAVAAYLIVAWVAWHIAGRPAGVEAVMVARLQRVRHVRRSRESGT